MRTFSPPRRIYPSGPLRRDTLSRMLTSQLAEIPVTKENVNQLAFFCDPLSPSTLRRHASFELEESDILDDSARRELFRNWPTQDLKRVVEVAQNFKLVKLIGGNAGVYFPATYWVDEDLGRAVRSGPYFVRPRSSTFRAIDLFDYKEAGTAVRLNHFERWSTMMHPHIGSDHKVCLGTEEDTYFNLKAAGDLYSLMCVFEEILKTYNPSSPFRHFNAQFPGSVGPAEEPEMEAELFWSGGVYHESSGGVYYESTAKSWTDEDLVAYRVGGYQVRLLPVEADRILRSGHRSFVQWFDQKTRDYLPSLIRGNSNLDEVEPTLYRLLRRIFMPGDDWAARVEASGIRVAPSFNQSDAEMTAVYNPYTKEQAIAFSQDNLDQAIQAQNSNASESETPEDSSEEEVATAHADAETF